MILNISELEQLSDIYNDDPSPENHPANYLRSDKMLDQFSLQARINISENNRSIYQGAYNQLKLALGDLGERDPLDPLFVSKTYLENYCFNNDLTLSPLMIKDSE